jgi:hypothetical protein
MIFSPSLERRSVRVNVLRSRVDGPLEPYAPGFAVELSRLGYTANSAAAQVGVVAHLRR